MLQNTPERLSRWMLLHEQPERLALEHMAQVDLAWAADEIATLKKALLFLIEVKDHKDANGKDDWYKDAQPMAWEQARKALET